MRRAKLYYLRDRTGKSARIAEKIKKKIGINIVAKPAENIQPTEVKVDEVIEKSKKEAPVQTKASSKENK